MFRDWPRPPSCLRDTSYLLRKLYHRWRVSILLPFSRWFLCNNAPLIGIKVFFNILFYLCESAEIENSWSELDWCRYKWCIWRIYLCTTTGKEPITWTFNRNSIKWRKQFSIGLKLLMHKLICSQQHFIFANMSAVGIYAGGGILTSMQLSIYKHQ